MSLQATRARPEMDQQDPLSSPHLLGVLEQFPPASAQALRHAARPRTWRDGETIFRCGQVAPFAIVLLSGRMRLSTISAEGNEQLFGWITPGELIGMESMLGDMPTTMESVAAGNCASVCFERTQFMAILQQDGGAGLAVARMASRRLQEVTRLLLSAQTARTLTSRVYAALVRLARRHENQADGPAECLRVSQKDIAQAVGASRQRVNIELAQLEMQGRIRRGYRHVVLLDPGIKRSN